MANKWLGGEALARYELSHKRGSALCREKWRRAWDLNPRNFRLPVFKTGALGRYASPPWERLPEYGSGAKIEPGIRRAAPTTLR